MTVRHGTDGLDRLRDLMTASHPVIDALLDPRAVDAADAGVDVTEPDRWLWQPAGATTGGWSDADQYAVIADADQRARIFRTAPAGIRGLSRDEQRLYARHSADIAMRGGTTSGVVYPLAVCELAKDRRLRNVGGASAGAIAAAAAAAAELGRSTGPPAHARAPTGRLRPGFPGLADLMAWLVQTDDPDAGEQYRLAALFRPAQDQRRLFAVAVAVMRQRFWAIPLAAFWALRWWLKVALVVAVTVVAIAVGSVVTALDPDDGGWWPGLARGALLLLAGGLAVSAAMGLLLVVPPLLRQWSRGRRAPRSWRVTSPQAERLQQHSTSRPATASDRAGDVTGLVLVFVLLVSALLLLLQYEPAEVVVAVLAALVLVLVLGVVVGLGVLVWALRAQGRSYGLVPGATPYSAARPVERLVGAAVPDGDPGQRALTPWLSDSLSDLAGLRGTSDRPAVLYFGHLWQGPDFVPLVEDSTGLALPPEKELRTAAEDPTHRLVNLVVMTTDLSRKRPWTFPLEPWRPDTENDDGELEPDPLSLWFDPADLTASWDPGRGGTDVLPGHVVQRMVEVSVSTKRVAPRADGTGSITLYRLPQPWNLPVVLAVRISGALPVLLSAVRLYRLRHPSRVRDDLGRRLDLRTPPQDDAAADKRSLRAQSPPVVAEELWLSDGGITSNFPVQLFDSFLPRWPSFGLNLGEHVPEQPVQDVWLPEDWQATVLPADRLGAGLPALLGAVVTSARNWRDNMQTAMPGYRGRVAWVRQHPGEGGNNLFMERTTIAALALRGALAGARLRARYSDQHQWDRHRWLRLRVSAANLDELRSRLSTARPVYADLLDGSDGWLSTLREGLRGDPDLPSTDQHWFTPGVDQYWQQVAELLDAVDGVSTDPGPRFSAGVPAPPPHLSQVPPV